jgi:hypothetical protein
MARLGIAAHDVLVIEGALAADSVRHLVDFLGQRLGSGKAEDVIDAPGHRLGPRIMPVAAKLDAGLGQDLPICRVSRRRCALTSTPDGVLPGRGTTATERFFSVS